MKLKFRRGLNLNIKGAVAPGAKPEATETVLAAVCPDDFPGFVPKVEVKEGDEVAVGSPLLYDKVHNDVKIVSPLAGRVKAVVRGERRKILRVEVEATDVKTSAPRFTRPADKASARRFLAESGLLSLIRQRPYDIVPDPEASVRDIFVTAIDSAPLAFSLEVECGMLFTKADVEAGVEVLRKITEGKVYVSVSADSGIGDIRGADIVIVEGRHPAGNVGVQIANIKPVDKGDTVWGLDIITLARIGHTAATGTYDASTIVALTGPEAVNPCLFTSVQGASLVPMLKGHVADDGRHHRIISGNVLTGIAQDADGWLHWPYRQISIIAEGDDVDEFMGWASFSGAKMSESRSFPGHFLKKLFSPDARINGGRRAMIMSGEYDRTLPMDIMPEYLIKAIMSHNIEDMEKLGIYEVAPEDFAAAEYADTSKLPLQKIVREGLDYLRKELE